MSDDPRSRPQKLFDQAIGVGIGALVVSFFAALWRGSERLDQAVGELRAANAVFSEQLAQLRVRDDRTVALSEAVTRSEKALNHLAEQVAAGFGVPKEALDLPRVDAPAPAGQFPQRAFTVQQSIQDEIKQRSK